MQLKTQKNANVCKNQLANVCIHTYIACGEKIYSTKLLTDKATALIRSGEKT
jgi:hypothetical protein